MDFLNSNPKVTLDTNPLPGRKCRKCIAFAAGECLAVSCEGLDDELDNLAILTAQGRGELPEVHPW